jgi:type I restriction enzyme M protein
MENSHQLVQKLWNYCNILRDDGLSYGDYSSNWRFCSFSRWRMSRAGRRSTNRHRFLKRRLAESVAVRWDELETHYRHVLESLGKAKGMLGG